MAGEQDNRIITKLAKLETRMDGVSDSLDEIKEDLKKAYATKSDLKALEDKLTAKIDANQDKMEAKVNPTIKIVGGAVALILTAVLTALIYLVVK